MISRVSKFAFSSFNKPNPPIKSLKLYNFCGSSASWRVRIVLNLKNLQYEYITINITEENFETKHPQYKNVNPYKRVPTLEINGNIIFESVAICQFLDEVFPTPQLIPSDPIQKAQVTSVCEIINSGIQPLQNAPVIREIKNIGGQIITWGNKWNTRGLAAIEEFIADKAGKYCFGDNLTLADAFLIPQISTGIDRYGVILSQFPTIERVAKNLVILPAFDKAHPQNQPDFVKNH